MANITITAANVSPAVTAIMQKGTAGELVTAGHPVYMDASANNVLKNADANVSVAAAAAVGIAANTAATGQPLWYMTGGDCDYGAGVFVAGTIYVLSDTVGAICPSADLDATTGTNYATILGVSSSTSNLKITILPSGVVNT